jgi:hypothetical protein
VKNIGTVKLTPINQSNLARNSRNVYLIKNSSRVMQKNTSMAHEKRKNEMDVGERKKAETNIVYYSVTAQSAQTNFTERLLNYT